ncbi:40S ribosomal protein S6 [Sciurus carolinensis]|uniref:Small ribosomal subunit protein eS6 n=1 Tax=Sciurus carolinensis TaxID=30640 RepID=A0AA41NFZ5_SCICA|nr:40S ribosomal protein S6 [Sciurus carolinensis]
MKLNISFPVPGCQKLIEVDNKLKLYNFYEKYMTTEIAANALGEEWKGRKPINKEGKKLRTKAPKIQQFVMPHVLQHKCLCMQRTQKNKEEAAEYAKLLTKRMKEAKEKHQEQIAKRYRLYSLKASMSEFN